MDTHKGFLEQAIALAISSIQQGGGPFGAIIVSNGEILAASGNQVVLRNDPTAHAEVMAIREACQKIQHFVLRGAVIYASCEPCPLCLSAIYIARLDAVYFAATRHDAARAGFNDVALFKAVCTQSEQQEITYTKLVVDNAQAPFQTWQQSTTKIWY